MDLIIPLTPAEEAQLAVAARQRGLAPVELVKRLAFEHLDSQPNDREAELDAKLRRWQEQDGTALLPDVSAQEQFTQWSKEDAQMTEAEREAEDQLWESLEQSLLEHRSLLQLRPML